MMRQKEEEQFRQAKAASMKDFDEEDWGDMPDLNKFQTRDMILLKHTVKAERLARSKLGLRKPSRRHA